jgi:putative acyl-CoA dehydrogenase
VCKRTPPHAAEALECLGGNGYVEESIMPRLYREAPLNSIWEGSGNVNALDVMRVLQREPTALEAFHAEIARVQGGNARLDAAYTRLRSDLRTADDRERNARRLTERMALVLQASLLVRFGDDAVCEAFCISRLDGDRGAAFGTLPAGCNFARIVSRAAVPTGAAP